MLHSQQVISKKFSKSKINWWCRVHSLQSCSVDFESHGGSEDRPTSRSNLFELSWYWQVGVFILGFLMFFFMLHCQNVGVLLLWLYLAVFFKHYFIHIFLSFVFVMLYVNLVIISLEFIPNCIFYPPNNLLKTIWYHFLCLSTMSCFQLALSKGWDIVHSTCLMSSQSGISPP